MSNPATFPLPSKIELINQRSRRRAEKAIQLLPFNEFFYKQVKTTGLNAETIFQQPHKYLVSGKQWFQSTNAVEVSFRWLIKIGVLRREVDGQGLTSKIRLTPLGRQILVKTPDLPSKRSSFLAQIINKLQRQWPIQ